MNLNDVSLGETELCWFIGVLRSFTREIFIKGTYKRELTLTWPYRKKLQTAKPKCKEPWALHGCGNAAVNQHIRRVDGQNGSVRVVKWSGQLIYYKSLILNLNYIIRSFWGGFSFSKPPFGVTSAEVVINCPEWWWNDFFGFQLPDIFRPINTAHFFDRRLATSILLSPSRWLQATKKAEPTKVQLFP